MQQNLYYVIENGLGSIFIGLQSILSSTNSSIYSQSQNAAIISIVLTVVSIVLVLVLLPVSFQPLTHVERISKLILMSLNRLPE